MTIPVRTLALSLTLFLLAGCGSHLQMLRTVNEPAGSHCAAGGVAVEAGTDANGNGKLDDAEVDASQTRYLCKEDQDSTLALTTPEPVGLNCADGGVRLDTGRDANGNRVLDPSEITATQYICNGAPAQSVHFGDIHIQTTADLALLDGVENVVGSVYLEGGDLGSQGQVAGLRAVSGSLQVGAVTTSAPSLSFPDLTSAPLLSVVGVAGVHSLQFPALTAVTDVSIFSNPQLTTAGFPGVQRMDTLVVTQMPLFTSLNLPQLHALTTLVLQDLPAFSHCAAEALQAQAQPVNVSFTDLDSSGTCP